MDSVIWSDMHNLHNNNIAILIMAPNEQLIHNRAYISPIYSTT